MARIVALGASVLLLAACAADDTASGAAIPDGYPTIASAEFNGSFAITAATVAGSAVELDPASSRLVGFDVVTGAAEVDLGCDRRLGSFTMTDDGRASITLTGQIVVDPCSPSDVDDDLWALIERVERWESTDGGFRLIATGGDNLVLTPV